MTTRRDHFLPAIAAGLTVLVLLAAADESPAREPLKIFFISSSLGEDQGQSFGSLFEIHDSNGTLVAGAGFADVYNTRFRSDRHTLQFFVRDPAHRQRYSTMDLPHPDMDMGVYLMGVNQELRAWTSARSNRVQRWNPEQREWIKETDGGIVSSGDGVMRVGAGVLRFLSNKATYDDRVILSPPEVGRYYNFYYALGHLFFYHGQRTDEGGFTRVLACRWKPGQEGEIDVSKAVAIEAKYVGATPFAWGQYKDQVLTVDNQGGVYVFQQDRWRMLLEADDQVSYQVYSMTNFYDRLYLAQYPTGNLFEYDGKQLVRKQDWPPRVPGVAKNAREAQTMAIYGGDLMVGVWPWAELWRYQHDTDSWHSMGRMFKHPALRADLTHPYEEQANRLDLVTNFFGQRITGMVPIVEGLMMSTSAKGTYEWNPKFDFLNDQQRREYGAVIKLQRPGCLAAQIQWTGKPIKFDFRVTQDSISVFQDGKRIAMTKHDMPLKWLSSTGLKMTLGKGAYGDFSGSIGRTLITGEER